MLTSATPDRSGRGGPALAILSSSRRKPAREAVTPGRAAARALRAGAQRARRA
jgi:hypothetical protein